MFQYSLCVNYPISMYNIVSEIKYTGIFALVDFILIVSSVNITLTW